MSVYLEKAPGGAKASILSDIYLRILLFVVGRALAAASRISPEVKKEVDRLPEGMVLCLRVLPRGPAMVVAKRGGALLYLGGDYRIHPITLWMDVKNRPAAMLLFTFRESTAMATAHDRILAKGDIPALMTVIRILDLVEVLLLPRFLAVKAVKRYPRPKPRGSLRIYCRTLTGIGLGRKK